MDKHAVVWVAAALVLVGAPAALLVGAEPWRVGAVMGLETALLFWMARWRRT